MLCTAARLAPFHHFRRVPVTSAGTTGYLPTGLLLLLLRRHGSNFAPRARFAMQTAYFKRLPDEDQCQISFHLLLDRPKIDKVFNFNRSLTEPVGSTLERIRANVEKEVLKKNKRRKVKKPAEAGDEPPAPTEPDVAVEVSLGMSTEELTGMTLADLIAGFDPAAAGTERQLTVLGTGFAIAFNCPEVATVKLPVSILADFYVTPSRLELNFATRECSEYEWSRGQMPASGNAQQIRWERVSHGTLTYRVQNADVGHHLKFCCTPKDPAGRAGPTTEIVSQQPVQAGPGQCPFELRHQFTQQKLEGDQFRVVSYNLLAELYADSDYSRTVMFGYTAPYALEMDYRKQLLVKELLGYRADIVCLQEVDTKVFQLDLVPIMRQKGLAGHYQAKRKVAEGLATFYDETKFEHLEADGVIISEILERYPELWNQIKDNGPLVERIMPRSTALQLQLLRCRHDPGKYLLVANTHLYFSPDADHIRLLQIGFAMLYVREQYERIVRDHQPAELALLFCGDFNSVPECGIYQLLTKRFVGPKFADWSSNKAEAVRGVSLAQPYTMESACGCPDFTNYTVGFKACIDYIFYQRDVLRVTDVVPMPTEKELTTYEAIPSPVFPSDHIALVANLQWARP